MLHKINQQTHLSAVFEGGGRCTDPIQCPAILAKWTWTLRTGEVDGVGEVIEHFFLGVPMVHGDSGCGRVKTWVSSLRTKES